MTDIPCSFLTHISVNALGISITVKSFSSYTYIIQDILTALVATVVELEYSLEMNSLFLFNPDTVLHFIVPSLFYLRNMGDYRILFFWYSVSYFY